MKISAGIVRGPRQSDKQLSCTLILRVQMTGAPLERTGSSLDSRSYPATTIEPLSCSHQATTCKVLKAQINKTDRNDARGIAR